MVAFQLFFFFFFFLHQSITDASLKSKVCIFIKLFKKDGNGIFM